MKITVMGGGNGAHAMSADLSLAGHQVTMFELPQFSSSIAAVQALREIAVYGETCVAQGREGVAKIHEVTTDPARATEESDLMFMCVPAFGQLKFMEAIAPHLRDGQVIVIMPGKFGALAFRKLLEEKGVTADVALCEAESLIYSTRLRGPARVWIMGYKKQLKFSCLPSSKVGSALGVVNKVFPQLIPCANVLETSIFNPGIIMHPSSVLLNVVKIEQLGSYKYSAYDITPSMANLMEAMDAERMAIAKSLDLEPLSIKDILHRFYGASNKSIYDAIRTADAYQVQFAPDSVEARYVTEDVPFGLVPIVGLGKMTGASTCALETVVNLAGFVLKRDFWTTGRTLDEIGLAGLTQQEILAKVG